MEEQEFEEGPDKKNKFAALKDKIVSWVQANKKLSIIIVSLLSIMLICIILLLVVSANKKKPVKTYEENLVLSQELMVPDSPELPRDYTLSRQTKEKWSNEEAEKWFSVPTEADINGLSKANDNMVGKILGGVP